MLSGGSSVLVDEFAITPLLSTYQLAVAIFPDDRYTRLAVTSTEDMEVSYKLPGVYPDPKI